MSRRVAAIHQPVFFPWLGYFDKLARCDVFVVMDNVQYNKSGKGTWSNRVMLRVAGRAAWVTATLDRAFSGVRMYRQMRFKPGAPWREKMVATLRMHYARARFFDEVFPLAEELVRTPDDDLCEYNLHTTRGLARALGLDAGKMVLGSELECAGSGTELLVSMTRAAGCDTYMCGGGAGGYQQDALFERAGLGLVYQDFAHPQYPQAGGGAFVAGLSVLDAMMNLGTAGTARLLGAP